MKPAVDFRLAEPTTVLDDLQPVEVPRPPAETPPSRFMMMADGETEESLPWIRMATSLCLCFLAWRYDAWLAQAAESTGVGLPLWVEAVCEALGREGGVAAALVTATALMIGAARRVLDR